MKHKQTLFSLAVFLSLTACYKQEYSSTLYTDGVVVQTIFRPYHTHTEYVPHMSTDAQGNSTVSFEEDTLTYYEQRWVVIAWCYGQIAVDRKELWERVHPGMKVRIRFHNITYFRKQNGEYTPSSIQHVFDDAEPLLAEWDVNSVKITKK